MVKTGRLLVALALLAVAEAISVPLTRAAEGEKASPGLATPSG